MNAEIEESFGDGDLVAITGEFDWLGAGHTTVMSLRFSPTGSGVGLGYDGGTNASEGLARMANPNDIIYGFGTPTYSGDDVTIPFTTLYDYCQNTTDDAHKITFTKPASLGRVVWSDGEVLDVYTVGGWAADPKWKFFNANLLIQKNYSGSSVSYQKKGSDFEDLNFSFLNDKPTLKATLQVTGTWTGESHDESEDDPHITAWEKPIFFDASLAYNDGKTDGIDEAKSKFGLYGPGAASGLTSDEESYLSTQSALSYGTNYEIYKTYDGSKLGDRKLFKTPTKGSYRTYAKVGDTEYTSGEIDLGTGGGSVTVYGQRKMDGESSYSSATGITVKASASSVSDVGTYDSAGNEKKTLSMGVNGSYTLYGGCKVNGTYQSGFSCAVSGPSLSSCTMYYVEKKTEGEGDDATDFYYFKTTSKITSNKTMYYS